MKNKAADNRLVLITLIAVSLSLFSLFLSFTRLSITGVATEASYVNLTVIPSIEITVWADSIRFTAAQPGQSRNSYNSSEMENCGTDNYCGINITNDGGISINITIQETENLFTGSTYNASAHFLYNTTMSDPFYTTAYGENGDCSTGYSKGLPGPDDNGQTGQWRAIPKTSSEVAICYLNYTDEPPDGNPEHRPDMAIVEINITVPTDETTGSKTGTLTFTGVAAA